MAQQVGWRAWALSAGNQGGGAHDRKPFRHQQRGLHAGPGAAAVADRGVHLAARHVRQPDIGLQLEVDIGVGCGERRKSRREPACGKRGQQSYLDGMPCGGGRADLVRALAQQFEGRMYALVVGLAGGGERHGARAPLKERDAQFGLQALNVMADGALRDEQFLRRLRKAQPPGGRFEGAQGYKGRQ
ncbi:hypothetical protein D3C71_1619380 [compost metagenome]